MQRRHALLTTLAAASLSMSACASGPADRGRTTLIKWRKVQIAAL